MKPTTIVAGLALALLSTTSAFAAGGGLGGPLTYGCTPDPDTGIISQKTCANWYGAMMLREDKRRLENALAVFSAEDKVAAVKKLTYPELQVLIVAMGGGLGGQRGISGNRSGIGRSVGEAIGAMFGNPSGRDVLEAIGAGFGSPTDIIGGMGEGITGALDPGSDNTEGGGPGGGSIGGAPGNGFGHGSSGTMGGGTQDPGRDY